MSAWYRFSKKPNYCHNKYAILHVCMFQAEVHTLQDRVDNLYEDFSSHSRQEMELKDQLADLEKESARQRDLLTKVWQIVTCDVIKTVAF